MSKLYNYLGAKSSYSPVWIDADNIAFISNESGVPQVWGMNLSSGEIKQYTSYEERVFALSSVPKLKTVLFTMDSGGDEQEQIYQLDQERKIQNLTDNKARNYLGGLIDEGKTLIMSSNERYAANFDIVALDVCTGRRRMVVENDDNYNMPSALSNDGRYLVYNKLKGESDNCFWLADLQSGKTKLIPEYAAAAKYSYPVFSSDDRYLYYLSDANSNYEIVYRYELDSGRVEELYQADGWGVKEIALSYDDKELAILVSEDGYSKLVIFDIDNRTVEIAEIPLGTISTIRWAPQSKKLLFSFSSGRQVADIWLMEESQPLARKLSNSVMEGIDRDLLVEPVLKRFDSFDGLSVPYWLYKPVDKQLRDLPVLIDIHGGPEGQALPFYDGVTQYLLAEGIAVVKPNVRGSTGYGKLYTHLDDKGKRLDSVKDIEYLVRHLSEEGIADRDKIAVMGGSYGGFMTLSCAARLPELFCCAVDLVGMFNLVTFLENTSEYRRVHRESEYGSLSEDREMLYNVSPVAKVDDIKGPLMVIHGANDPRVPVSEAEDVVAYLAQKGIEVEYLRYEDEGHGLSKLKNRLDCYPKVVEFLKTNMKI